MKNLQKLKEQETALSIQLTSIKDQISELETITLLPAAKKEYEGKFFKYRNSYGGDMPKWWLYIMVTKVISANKMEAISFETDCYGGLVIESGKTTSQSFLNNPITKTEFATAYAKALDKIGAKVK